MYSIFVTINVKPEYAQAFAEASVLEGQGAVRDEPDCFRFDLLKDESDSNRFYFFEIFRDKGAAEAHWETPHFKTWRQTVDNMVDGEFVVINMQTVFPSDDGLVRQKPGLLNW